MQGCQHGIASHTLRSGTEDSDGVGRKPPRAKAFAKHVRIALKTSGFSGPRRESEDDVSALRAGNGDGDAHEKISETNGKRSSCIGEPERGGELQSRCESTGEPGL